MNTHRIIYYASYFLGVVSKVTYFEFPRVRRDGNFISPAEAAGLTAIAKVKPYTEGLGAC